MRRTPVQIGRAVVLLAAAGLVVAGCGSNNDTSSKPSSGGSSSSAASQPAASGTLTVWADETRVPIITAIGQKFTQDKGVKVTVIQRDFGKMKDDFSTQAKAGKGPDILIGANDWVGQLADQGAIAPLELGDKASELQQVAVDAFSYQGQTYGLPYAVENIALIRNTALAPQAPSSFDDMVATGKKLVASGKATLPFAVQQDPQGGDPYHLYPIETSFGSQVFASDGKGGYDASKLTVGDANGLKFAEWLSKNGDKGTKVVNSSVNGDVAKNTFAKGKVPYIITGPWNLEAFKGMKISVEQIPSAGGETAAPFVGVQGFMVNSKSANALLANDFVVNYLGTEDAMKQLFTAGGRPSAMTSVFEASKSDPIYKGFGEVGAAGVPAPNVPAMNSVWESWGKTELAIVKGGDPDELWKKMAADIDAKIKSGS